MGVAIDDFDRIWEVVFQVLEEDLVTLGVSERTAFLGVATGAAVRQHHHGIAGGVLQAVQDVVGDFQKLGLPEAGYEYYGAVEHVVVVLPLIRDCVGLHQDPEVFGTARA